MGKCPECQRNLPLSGKCPYCQKDSETPGFSLNRILTKKNPAIPGNTKQPVAEPVSQSKNAQTEQPAEISDSQPKPEPANDESSIEEDPLAAIRAHAAAVNAKPLTSADSTSILDSPVVHPAEPHAQPSPPPESTAQITASAPTASSTRPTDPISPSPNLPRTSVPNAAFAPKPQKPVAPSARLEKPFEMQKKTSLVSKTPGKSEEEQKGDESIFSSSVTGFGDEEMECSILSGLLNDNYILEQSTIKGLVPGLFSTKYSRALCKAIVSLREENREGSLIDKIVIKNKLKQQGTFDLPMQNFLTKVLAQPTPTLDQVLHYMEILKEQSLKRKLKEVAETINRYLDDPSPEKPVSIENFANTVIREVREVQKAKASKKINLVKEEMRGIIKDIEDREVHGEIDIIGYSFHPMNYLNTAISGFRKGFMYAIAGAPRRGKTTFTLELATLTAMNNQLPVLFFTYEQTKKNLTYRLLAKESRLNPDTLQRRKIRSDMIMDAKFMGGWKRMQAYMDYFYIVEATKIDTIDRIRSYAYNAMQDFNTDDLMIFVDYIQKMPLSRDYLDEKFKVEEISTELKALSIELNNPIMTVSSLSKEGCMIDASESAERPTMYHCKGSGDLEYDLDCAMIQAKDWGDTRELYQQLQHKAEELNKDSTRVPKVDVVNLYLDKNRDAPEGIYSIIQYLFFIEDNKFIELGPKYEDDRFRYSKIEMLVDELIQNNYIIFYDRVQDSSYSKGRVSIKLKNT